jgi:NADPH-dependent F420 reductase
MFDAGRPRLAPPPEGSAAEHLRARLPDHVRLAGAFKTMPARLLEEVEAPLDCDEFVCGDSPEARQRTMALLARLPGLRPIDAGPLEAARALEHMTWLVVLLNKRYKSHAGRFHVLGLGEGARP